MMQTRIAAVPRNHKKGGSGLIITSGLGMSWVLVLLGPWSLERGRGWSGFELVTPCARSAVADIPDRLLV